MYQIAAALATKLRMARTDLKTKALRILGRGIPEPGEVFLSLAMRGSGLRGSVKNVSGTTP